MSLETLEDINVMLDTLGDDLDFDSFSIKGFLGFETSILYKEFPSPTEVKKQDFSFQVSANAVKENSIVLGNTFTISDTTYTYTFKIVQTPLPDAIGWMQLDVEYNGKVAL